MALEVLSERNLGFDTTELSPNDAITLEQKAGGLVLDLAEIDFDAMIYELEEIDVDRIIIDEFRTSLDINTEGSTERKSIQQVITQVEFFLSQPAIQNAMSQLDALARQFAHMCSAADGHGGFSVDSLVGIAKSFYEQGSHSENDGHGHGKSLFADRTSKEQAEDSSDEDTDQYEWVFVEGRWQRRKKTKKR